MTLCSYTPSISAAWRPERKLYWYSLLTLFVGLAILFNTFWLFMLTLAAIVESGTELWNMSTASVFIGATLIALLLSWADVTNTPDKRKGVGKEYRKYLLRSARGGWWCIRNGHPIGFVRMVSCGGIITATITAALLASILFGIVKFVKSRLCPSG